MFTQFSDPLPKMEKALVYQHSPLHPSLQTELEEHFHMVQPKDLNACREKITALYVFVAPPVDAALIDSLPNLKVVGCCAVGYSHVDLEACKRRGIRVGYTPQVLNDATADMAWALLLATARRLVEGDHLSKHPSTSKIGDVNWLGMEVSHMTLGIIGMGRIGMEIARRARGFEMEVLYHNRSRQSQDIEEALQATFVESLNDILSRSDHVILVAPATSSTYHMMGKKQFAAMKKTATFINISRGSLVDHEALVEALKTGVICAAGLDVTDPEPLPRDHPLLQLTNVVLTPHTGSATFHTRKQMVRMTIGNIQGALSGGEMVNEVSL